MMPIHRVKAKLQTKVRHLFCAPESVSDNEDPSAAVGPSSSGLCNVCLSIFRGPAPRIHPDENFEYGLVHHQTAKSLLSSARKRCSICHVLWIRYSADTVNLLGKAAENSKVYCWYFLKTPDVELVSRDADSLTFVCFLDRNLLQRVWDKFPQRKRYPRTYRFELDSLSKESGERQKRELLPPDGPPSHIAHDARRSSQPDPRASQTGQGLAERGGPLRSARQIAHDARRSSSMRSAECWSLAASWIQTCRETHTRCTSQRSGSWKPTRLLDLGTETAAEIRLVLSVRERIRGDYITLSHRWGGQDTLELSQANIEEFQNSIPQESLPRTYSDTVVIARRMGIRYLWIDSLCIMQDSEDDWTREAAEMGKVYYHSICNVAATGAWDSHAGLFVERNTRLIEPCFVTTDWLDRPPAHYSVAYNFFWTDEMVAAPLNRRAWVIQERLLAPRVLHFGRAQLMWECHELEACETYPNGLPPALASDPFSGFKNLDAMAWSQQAGGRHENSNTAACSLWNRLVFIYMRCKLTRPADKLVALSGHARRMERDCFSGVQYLAGLWRRFLPSQLLWFVWDCRQVDGRPSDRPDTYRAPSWSWASIDARIALRYSTRARSLIEVLDASTRPRPGNDAFGQIADARLEVAGFIFPARIDEPFEGCYSSANELLFPMDVLLDNQWTRVDKVHLDVRPPPRSDPGLNLHCLPVQQRGSEHNSIIEGLILQSCGGLQHHFRRYGYFEAYEATAAAIAECSSSAATDSAHKKSSIVII